MSIRIENDLKKWISLNFLDAVQVEKQIWFSAASFNGLFCSSISTGKTRYIGQFPEEKFDKILLHSKVEVYKGKLIFFPASSKGIDIYDMNKKEFRKVLLPSELLNRENTEHTKTIAVEQFQQKFIIVGLYLHAVIFFDASAERIEYIKEFEDEIVPNRKLPIFKRTICRKGKYILALCAQNPDILCIDVEKQQFHFFRTDHDSEFFDTISCCEKGCLLTRKKNVYFLKKGNIRKILSLTASRRNVISFFIDGWLYLISNQDSVIAKELSTEKEINIRVKEKDSTLWVSDGVERCIYSAATIDNRVILSLEKSNVLYIIGAGKIQSKVYLELSDTPDYFIEQFKRHFLKLFQKNGSYHEKTDICKNVLGLLGYVAFQQQIETQHVKYNGGRLIHKQMLQIYEERNGKQR